MLDGERQPLTLVAMVVGHQHVGDAVDPEVLEESEDLSGAPVDADRRARVVLAADEVDVTRVRDPHDAVGDRGGGGARHSRSR